MPVRWIAMCGIAALLDPSRTTPESAARAMSQALHHRGPDFVRRLNGTFAFLRGGQADHNWQATVIEA
jgi:hypothetical protein